MKTGWAAFTFLVTLLMPFSVWASDDVAALNQSLEFAEKVESLSQGLTKDLCYFYQFRVDHSLPLAPMTQADALVEVTTVVKNWSPELKNAYAAHLLISRKGAQNVLGINDSDRPGSSGFLFFMNPSKFTDYLLTSRGFLIAFHASPCRKWMSFDRFQQLILREDIAARTLVELAATGGVLKAGSLLMPASWKAQIAKFFTRKVLIVTGVTIGGALVGTAAYDVWLMKSHETAVKVGPAPIQLDEEEDFLHIMVDEFYGLYRPYAAAIEVHPENRDRLREAPATWTKRFMERHGQTVQARYDEVSKRLGQDPGFIERAKAVQAKKIHREALNPEEIKLLQDISFLAKLDLLLEFNQTLSR